MTEEIFREQFLKKLDQKLECIIITSERVKSIDEKVTLQNQKLDSLHDRVDSIELNHVDLKHEQRQIRKDFKMTWAWVVGIGTAVWGAFKLYVLKAIH